MLALKYDADIYCNVLFKIESFAVSNTLNKLAILYWVMNNICHHLFFDRSYCMCLDVLQRQRSDTDTDADNRRRDSRAGTDPGRGSGNAWRLQHERDDRAQKPLPSSADLRR